MLRKRSQEKELIDLGSDHYSNEEYTHCLRMLFRVNRLFGFFYGTRKFLKKFLPTSSVLDVGCGGGLFLLHLSNYFPQMKLVGTDISYEAIKIAQQNLQAWKVQHPVSNVSFILQTKPILELPENSFDIILATLVCHHLTDDELIIFLKQMLSNARRAVIINDLHRNSFAHGIYRIISPILFRNRLITHDGLISIRRSFSRTDWLSLLQQAGIDSYQITWCFPFRWRVILWKKL